jgi:hypothetical protein
MCTAHRVARVGEMHVREETQGSDLGAHKIIMILKWIIEENI